MLGAALGLSSDHAQYNAFRQTPVIEDDQAQQLVHIQTVGFGMFLPLQKIGQPSLEGNEPWMLPIL